MIGTFVAAFVVMAILFAAMAVGVIFSNKPIKGSCGGLSALGMKGDCEICGGNRDRCEQRKGDPGAARLGYDAARPPPRLDA